MVLFIVALPKGSLNDPKRGYTEGLLKRSGLEIAGYSPDSRNYRPVLRNFRGIDLVVDRPQNMPVRIAHGIYAAGILGRDIAEEWMLGGFGLEEILPLGYGKSRLVAASCRFEGLEELMSSEKPITCATEYPLVTRYWLLKDKNYIRRFSMVPPQIVTRYACMGENKGFRIYESYGATESSVLSGGDLIVDTIGTGNTLRINGLNIIGTLLESEAVLYKKPGLKSEKLDLFTAVLDNALREGEV